MPAALTSRDALLALVIATAWGVNFTVIKLGLHGVPPMLLLVLRFVVAAVPAVFFIRRPAIPWRWLFAYAFSISVAQFGFLFTALHLGMPAGLASLVLQSQVFFTMLLAAAVLGERMRAYQWLGLAVAALGLARLSGWGGTAVDVPWLGIALTLCAAISWAIGNMVTKQLGRFGKVDLLGLVVWASLIPPLPFLALSLVLEGPERIVTAVRGFDGMSVFAVAYLAYVSTLLGYGLWSRLLSRYPAAQVTPFALLVPVSGLGAAVLVLGERLDAAQVQGALAVMAGLLVTVYGARWRLLARG